MSYPYGTNPLGGGAPYAAPYRASTPTTPVARNPYARPALIYGALSFVVTLAAAFLGYYVIGFLALYALYMGVKGARRAAKLPTSLGLMPSVFGIVFSVVALLLTIAVAAGIV